jgi:Protein of unknown function (DUF3047)
MPLGPALAALLTLTAFAEPGAPPAPWRFEGLPNQKAPATQYEVVQEPGRPGERSTALRVQAERSYGNLVHPLTPAADAGSLSWRWRLDKPVERTQGSLHDKAGDDAALKVCALFDLPQQAVPLAERWLLRLAESRSGRKLPRATLCYLFDNSLPPGSLVTNPYTARVRAIVLGGALQRWHEERRDLAADFLRAFADEAKTVPPVTAIVIAGDADNTGSSTLGYVDALRWSAGPP